MEQLLIAVTLLVALRVLFIFYLSGSDRTGGLCKSELVLEDGSELNRLFINQKSFPVTVQN